MNKAPVLASRGPSKGNRSTPSSSSAAQTPPQTPTTEHGSPRIIPGVFNSPGGFDANVAESSGQQRMVLAIDYGTTFTGLAYAFPESDYADVSQVRVMTNWGDGMSNDVKIPSVISYSPCTGADEQQFGASLSPDAVAMVNTKLELDAQDTRLDELDLLLQVLDGMKNLDFEHVKSAKGYPGYTWKKPEDIVTDYLSKVFQCFEDATEHLMEIKLNVPVDIIITVPVNWSYRAKNATLRAITNAGFNQDTFPLLNQYLFVNEPEAASIYTVRYLKQREAEKLKRGECFVLCDAGGGTVDVVAFKVKSLEPTLEIEQLTIPTGAKYGSSFINGYFKEWLRTSLGGNNYSCLDPNSEGQKISAHATEGGKMRLVMNQFEARKKAFHGHAKDTQLDLPHPLDHLNIEGFVEDGELTMTPDAMQSFFDPCVDRVVELIQSQITQVERKRNRVKTVLLIGGFSESQYLQEELGRSLRLRKIKLHRPDTSWSAVVRGAVLYGMEASNRVNQTRAFPCPRSYGAVFNNTYSKRMHDDRDVYKDEITNQTMVRGQITWLVSKGDLLLENSNHEIEKEILFCFRERDSRTLKISIYEYLDEDIPDRYETAQDELTEVAVLESDFGKFKLDQFERRQNVANGQVYYQVELICRLTIAGKVLIGETWWNDQVLGAIRIENIDEVRHEEN